MSTSKRFVARPAPAGAYSAMPAPTAAAKQKVLAFYSDKEGKQYREFSNFFRQRRPFRFRIPVFAQREGFPKSIACEFTEKAIMATKASLMQDLEAFQAIDAAVDPKSCKQLGRGVRNFDDALWNAHLEEVAFEVVRQKFESDPALGEVLLSTGTRILAEAAPNDCVWGIGLPLSDDRARDPSCWRGRNILGFALMRAREHLRGSVLTAEAASAAAGITRGTTGEQELAGPPGAKSASSDGGAPSTDAALQHTERPASAGTGGEVTDEQAPAGRSGPEPASRDGGTCAAAPAAPNESATSLQAGHRADAAEATGRRRWGRQKPPAPPPAPGSEPQAAQAQAAAAEVGDRCFAVLDFEATCDDQRRVQPQEVIEFPVVLVDPASGTPLSEFRTYVRPTFHPQLTTFCRELTGIQQSDVDDAPTWTVALAQAEEWLDGELRERGLSGCIFVTCGDWDLGQMMGRQCEVAGCHVPARFRRWLNIKDLFGRVVGRPGKSMPAMLDALKLELRGRHHSGLDDCRNIAQILQVLLRDGGSEHVDAMVKSGAPARGPHGATGGGRRR